MATPETELSELEDEELISRAQLDDAAAFTELFDRFHPMIYAFCYKICLNAATAQDIAQDTFIKAARAIRTLRGGSSFKAWIYKIATNAARDWQRQHIREARLTEALTHHWNEPSVAAEETGEESEVAAALKSLPDDLRVAIVLVYYEGMNHAMAAQIIGCAETTVSWRVFRAKSKLKALLLKNREAL